MSRVLLVLPSSSYRADDFLDAARRLRAKVVIASDHRSTLASMMGDGMLRLDLQSPSSAAARIVELAARAPLDAVVAVDEQGVLVAAEAASRLGLPHNPVEAVRATRDKAKMRRLLADAGVRQPGFALARYRDDVARVALRVGLPCVVKPTGLSGSRGVMRADSAVEAAGLARRARAVLADAGENRRGPLLVERFVPGAEVAVEGLVEDGLLRVLAIFDKPDPLNGPYFEETLYVAPARLSPAARAEIEATTAAAAAAIGLRDGPVHAELRIRDDRAWVIEVAARSIGGLCSRALRFGLGTTLEEVILRHALGREQLALEREGAAAGVMMLPIPRSGILRRVEGVDHARGVPGIEGVEITLPAGRAVRALPEGDRYLGFAFARGTDPDEVEAALRKANAALKVIIE
ncbi:MAG: ATP-grasp domain-containing protein [Egibacteraceae bacterium]